MRIKIVESLSGNVLFIGNKKNAIAWISDNVLREHQLDIMTRLNEAVNERK